MGIFLFTQLLPPTSRKYSRTSESTKQLYWHSTRWPQPGFGPKTRLNVYSVSLIYFKINVNNGTRTDAKNTQKKKKSQCPGNRCVKIKNKIINFLECFLLEYPTCVNILFRLGELVLGN